MEDLIRIGRVSSVNYKNGTAKIVYSDRDDMVTGELPTLATEYNMPKINDLVLVLHTKKGKSKGVIIGQIYSDRLRPEVSGKNKYQKKMGSTSGITVSDDEMVINAKSITFECDSGSISLSQIISHIT